MNYRFTVVIERDKTVILPIAPSFRGYTQGDTFEGVIKNILDFGDFCLEKGDKCTLTSEYLPS